ncbi:MAG: hypothetical protein MPI93_06325 [Nitrosopumilus sp.]|nr:hypothetical protein [Nitrosopumilus sp.]
MTASEPDRLNIEVARRVFAPAVGNSMFNISLKPSGTGEEELVVEVGNGLSEGGIKYLASIGIRIKDKTKIETSDRSQKWMLYCSMSDEIHKRLCSSTS